MSSSSRDFCSWAIHTLKYGSIELASTIVLYEMAFTFDSAAPSHPASFAPPLPCHDPPLPRFLWRHLPCFERRMDNKPLWRGVAEGGREGGRWELWRELSPPPRQRKHIGGLRSAAKMGSIVAGVGELGHPPGRPSSSPSAILELPESPEPSRTSG